MNITFCHMSPLFRIKFIHLTILGIIVLTLYHTVFSLKFQLEWDDQWQVINSMTEGGFSIENIQQIFCELYGRQYSPINQLYYTFLYKIGGYNPALFHAGNLIFHLFNVFVVYLLSIFLYSKFVKGKEKYLMAFCSSLLFAIHPAQVESICWVSASKVVLSTFFYLLALLLYIGYTLSYYDKKVLFIGSLCCALVSMGCKEQAVTICLSLLLIDVFILKRNMRNIKVYIEKLWFVVPSIIFAILSHVANGGTSEDTIGYVIEDRIVFFFYSLFKYIMLSLFPFKLSYLYPFPYQVGENMPQLMFVYPFIILFIVYLIHQYRHQKIIVFCASFFLLNLLPMLHIIPLPRYFIIADRYLYLPYISFSICLVWIIFKYKQIRYKHLLLIGVIYISYLGGYTSYYATQWKDSTTLKHNFRDILKQRGVEYNEGNKLEQKNNM